mgnify:CR=1 FL=1
MVSGLFCFLCAQDWTRTSTLTMRTWPSTMRVYHFRHLGRLYFKGTKIAISFTNKIEIDENFLWSANSRLICIL